MRILEAIVSGIPVFGPKNQNVLSLLSGGLWGRWSRDAVASQSETGLILQKVLTKGAPLYGLCEAAKPGFHILNYTCTSGRAGLALHSDVPHSKSLSLPSSGILSTPLSGFLLGPTSWPISAVACCLRLQASCFALGCRHAMMIGDSC